MNKYQIADALRTLYPRLSKQEAAARVEYRKGSYTNPPMFQVTVKRMDGVQLRMLLSGQAKRIAVTSHPGPRGGYDVVDIYPGQGIPTRGSGGGSLSAAFHGVAAGLGGTKRRTTSGFPANLAPVTGPSSMWRTIFVYTRGIKGWTARTDIWPYGVTMRPNVTPADLLDNVLTVLSPHGLPGRGSGYSASDVMMLEDRR